MSMNISQKLFLSFLGLTTLVLFATLSLGNGKEKKCGNKIAGNYCINLKCDPEKAIELREEFEGVTGAYHMSKKHWNTLYIDEGELETKLILKLINHSYDMVVKGLPKKLRDSI